jgi:hypothetical protein
MNTITIILTVVAVILLEGLVIYALARDRKKLKSDNKKLEQRIIDVTSNINLMTSYIEKILAIKADTQSTIEKIKEAKTDEEVLNILSDIISANNNRVQND